MIAPEVRSCAKRTIVGAGRKVTANCANTTTVQITEPKPGCAVFRMRFIENSATKHIFHERIAFESSIECAIEARLR
eukprot:8966273-Pyramimonas_sp.AAC.2